MGVDWSKAPEWAKTVIASSGNLRQLYWFECYLGRGKCRPINGGLTAIADNIPPSNWVVIESRPNPADERIDDLPPIGDCIWSKDGFECEVYIFSHYGGHAHGWSCEHDCGFSSDNPGHFKPLRTQEEVDRDALVNQCAITIGRAASHEQVAAHMFNLMTDSGYRKTGEEVGRDALISVMRHVRTMVREVTASDIANAMLAEFSVTKKGE